MSLDRRRERAAGRLLDDERLRGGLEDHVFAPIQAWALRWIDVTAMKTAELDESAGESALDVGLTWIRSRVGVVVGLLEFWPSLQPSARREQVNLLASTFPAPALVGIAAIVAELSDPAAAARHLAAALPIA